MMSDNFESGQSYGAKKSLKGAITTSNLRDSNDKVLIEAMKHLKAAQKKIQGAITEKSRK